MFDRSEEWGGGANGSCYNETSMIEDPSYWGSITRKNIMQVIGEVFGKSKVPITFLNITQLSNYRKDAHTSIYKKQWNPLTPEQLANPVSYADCVHWCLPGLQDTWNELLFAKLFYSWVWSKLKSLYNILIRCSRLPGEKNMIVLYKEKYLKKKKKERKERERTEKKMQVYIQHEYYYCI